jgi:hypothetical protein
MRVIAFAGPAQSGKTTVAGLVEQNAIKAGYRVVREAFAGPLKRAAERVGAGKQDDPDKYRSLCQRWGAEKRKKEPGFWVRRMRDRLEKTNLKEIGDYSNIWVQAHLTDWKETLVIIDDVRYLNEVELVKGIGGVVVFIDPGKRINLDDAFRRHESEKLAIDYMEGQLPSRTFDDMLVNGVDNLEALSEMMEIASYFWFDELYEVIEKE